MRENTYMVYCDGVGILGGFTTLEAAIACANEDIEETGIDGFQEDYANGGLCILKVVSESYLAEIHRKSDLFKGDETDEERQEILDSDWPVSDEFDAIWDVRMRPIKGDSEELARVILEKKELVEVLSAIVRLREDSLKADLGDPEHPTLLDWANNVLRASRSIHVNIAKDAFPEAEGTTLTCASCGTRIFTTREDVARYLAHGWPKCCGMTMKIL